MQTACNHELHAAAMLDFYGVRIEPSLNRRRGYSVHRQPRLLGGIDVVCHFGRLGFAGGHTHIIACADDAAAADCIERLVAQRKRRGDRPSTAKKRSRMMRPPA